MTFRRGGKMSRLVYVVMALAFFVGVVWSEIHPVDVEPVMKKEQPDFEDDTGNGAVLPSGSGDRYPNSSQDKKESKDAGDVSFMHAFVAALSMIIVTELGDKTFFIAAIMAMNHPRLTVFTGAMLALTVMHIMSARVARTSKINKAGIKVLKPDGYVTYCPKEKTDHLAGANITLIPKGISTTSNPSQYQPISITPVLSRKE